MKYFFAMKHTTLNSLLNFFYPLPCARDTVVIPSTCIRERDIVVTLLVRVSVCLSVCLCVST